MNALRFTASLFWVSKEDGTFPLLLPPRQTCQRSPYDLPRGVAAGDGEPLRLGPILGTTR
jgi:hypothetical protein